MLVGSRLSRPLRDVGAAARRIARGDYDARIPRAGPEEIVSLADSFNQMAAALEEQERVRREFIANAAHELRTPLTNLKGYLEALRDGVIPPDRATFESLWDEAERLVRLSRSLDTLAEGDAGHPVQAGRRRFRAGRSDGRSTWPPRRPGRPASRSSWRFRRHFPPKATPTASPRSSPTSSRTRSATRRPAARSRFGRRPGPAMRWSRSSTPGPGIPAADLPHVFERFYRVEKSRDAARGGAGIGLAIVRQLVEAAGGRVGAESSGGLTRFWFSLPRAGDGS